MHILGLKGGGTVEDDPTAGLGSYGRTETHEPVDRSQPRPDFGSVGDVTKQRSNGMDADDVVVLAGGALARPTRAAQADGPTR